MKSTRHLTITTHWLASLATTASLFASCLLASCMPAKNEDANRDGKASQKSAAAPSDRLSKWLRTHPEHYWQFMRDRTDLLTALAPLVALQGVIAGDPHIGNFSVLPVRKAIPSEAETLQYLNIDFDDAGRGPFLLDWLRLLMVTKASTDDVKTKAMLEAYIQGLLGNDYPEPTEVSALTKLSVQGYRKLAEEEIDKDTTQNKFRLKPGKLEPDGGEVSRTEIQRLLGDRELLDVARRPADNNEKASGLRLWIYARERLSRARRLFELKEYQPSRLQVYQAQLPLPDWVSEVRSVFWPGIDYKSYDLIQLSDGRWFWWREKKLTLIDPRYGKTDSASAEYINQFARYNSYVLGLAHGRQPQGRELGSRLGGPEHREGLEAIRDQIKELVRVYLNEANLLSARSPNLN